jgi:hypothetical protein
LRFSARHICQRWQQPKQPKIVFIEGLSSFKIKCQIYKTRATILIFSTIKLLKKSLTLCKNY